MPQQAAGRGLKAIIAGAGGAAHLPGMLAAKTTVPVLGVPVASRHLQGVDSLHSIVQMPKGIPVATFAIGAAGAANAALFAVAMLANEQPALRAQLDAFRARQTDGGARHDAAARRMTEPVFLPPGSTLGVMGGGQLGRMFVHAAQRLGYATAVLDPDADSPAGKVSHVHVRAGYLDEAGLARCAKRRRHHHRVRERAGRGARHARRAAVRFARRGGGRHRPGPGAGEGALPRCGVPCAPHAVIETREQLEAVADDLLPGILKTARLGYDGKGQARVSTPRRTGAAWDATEGRALRAGEAAAAAARMLGGRGARRRRRHGAPAGAAQPAPRRHPGRHRSRRGRRAGAPRGRRPSPPPAPSRKGSTTSACCASSSSCCRTARWWSTRWRRGRTTAGTGASTAPTCRSSTCRCARWPGCRWWRRGSTATR
jgi:phosphoribosylaminoimidazole carboxylase PurE protein